MFNENHVQKIVSDYNRGIDVGDKLVYDRRTKTARSARRDPDSSTIITQSDADLSSFYYSV